MKICYFDESGTGHEPVAVVIGIVVDTQRMHVTKEHWIKLLSNLSDIVGKPLQGMRPAVPSSQTNEFMMQV